MFKKMGKTMLLLIALVLTLCVAAVAAAEPQTFTGEADGFGGPVKVEVTVDGGRISDVTVVEQNETQGVGTNAIDQLPGRIVETQSIGLDAVAGCTVSSRALLSAVENALSDAGLDMDALKAPPASGTQGEDETLDTDVVVVGAGIAGLSAAITAKQNGADVVLLEKMSFTGGNSKLSTGVFQFGGTDVQAAAGIEDTPEAFYEFAMEKSGNKRDPVQVRLVAEHGKEDVNWLKSIGVEIADEVSPVTGSAVERGHQGLPNAPGMMDKMTEVAEELGVDLHLNTAADALLTDESGRIVGVTAVTADGSKLTVNAKNTILAAGGFAADPEKLKKYWGLDNVGSRASPGRRAK